MNKSNLSILPNDKKLNIFTAVLIFAGMVIAICLVFFFIQLFSARSKSITPTVYNAKQIGATESSVLIVWSNSEAAKEFIVRYRRTDSKETTEFRTDKSFAAVHDLDPFTKYKALIIPVDNEKEYDPVTVICNTSPYCHITELNIDSITNTGAHITWNYEGVNEGFTVVAYAVDKAGRRHLTSNVITVPKENPKECDLEGLFSEVNYTVCVMPNTKYATVQKLTFTTDKYSRLYNKYSIARFVIATSDSANSIQATAVSQLTGQQAYMTSMILSGTAHYTETINMETYVTDTEGNILSHNVLNDVILNPDEQKDFFYRTFAMDFTAPTEPGNYYVFAVLDGVTVRKNAFKVV